MTYEELLDRAARLGLTVKEAPLVGNAGRVRKNRIAIKRDIPTSTGKACVLAEELGHYYTSVGDIRDMGSVDNLKQEYRARAWAYNLQIGLMGLVRAAHQGCTSVYEIADFLGVSETFLRDALDYYREKYSPGVLVGNYWVTFCPSLQVYTWEELTQAENRQN